MIQESPSSELMITLSPIELIAVCLGLVGVGILIAFIVHKVFSPADKSYALPRDILHTQNQEEYFKELLTLVKQSAHISVWSSNVETGEFFSDAFFWELYGISPIENLDISDTAHVEDLPRARALVRKVVKNTNGQNRYEIRHRTTNPHKDKQYIQSYFNVLRNETGQATHIIGISWDVTEEVEKEQRLKAMAARFEVAVKSASLHVWEFDYSAGRYTWLINPIKNFGLDDVPLESFHKAIYKIALPEDRHIFYDSPTEAYQSGKDTYTVTQRYRGKDGNVIHFKGCIRILSGTSIEDFRVLGVGWDETDKVLRENTLQEQIKKEQTLSQRLDVATRASNFSPWEFDLNTKSYSWLGAKISNKLNHLTDEEYSTFLINSVKPEVRSRIIDVRKKAIINGLDYYDFQYELENIDGTTIHAKSHVRILRNEKGVALKLVGVVADITEYINMNQRLEKQTHAAETLRQRLKLSIQTAGIAAFELDMRTRRFDWIENSIDGLKGSSGKEQSLNEFQKRVHPDDQNLLINNINKALSESIDSISYRYRYYNNDGELRHMQIFCKIFLDNDGVVEKLIGAGWDVSSEVNSANKLYAQTQLLDQVKRRLERASISSSEGHWERNLLDQSAWCSSSFYTLLGYNKDVFDTQGDFFKQLLYTDDYSTYEIALQSHLYGNTPLDIKVRLIRANQENRWFRLRGMAERNQQGDPIRVAGSIQDIHQQKLNEDVLYQTQQRFERAINGTQDGLYEFDFANDTIWCSPRLSAMLGYPAKQLETPGFAESLIHPDDVTLLIVSLQNIFATTKPLTSRYGLNTVTAATFGITFARTLSAITITMLPASPALFRMSPLLTQPEKNLLR
ncbi:hypothetical protein NBRC116495_37970 [Aurantivibrio plasticivorans]